MGGGGARHMVCVLGTLYSVHGQPPPPPPPPLEGRMAACRHLQFGCILIWLEEGLGIGGVSHTYIPTQPVWGLGACPQARVL